MNDEKCCQRFRELLDGYMDDTLSQEDKQFVKAHTQACETCRQELSLLTEIKAAIGGLDDDIVVPLPAQAAWRSAVRKEIRLKKNKKIIRFIASAAAAVVVLFATTFAMRETGALPPRMIEEPFSVPAAGAASLEFTAVTETAAFDAPMMRSAGYSEEIVLEADGEMDEVIVGGQQEENIIRSCDVVKASADIEADIQSVYDLTEEYEGYISEDIRDFALQSSHATLVCRIPCDLMEDYITALENVAETLSVSRYSQDADAVYYDIDARLESKKAIRDEMNKAISGADGEKLNELNLMLNGIHEEIDTLERLVSTRDNDLAYAKVTISLSAQAACVTPAESTLAERSATGFMQSLKGIGEFFQDMVVSVAVIAPAVILIGVIALAAYLAVRNVKKTRKKNKEDE